MSTYTTNVSDKKKSTLILLHLIGLVPFLGGLKDFYVGRIAKGLVCTITCNWLYLGWIKDLIPILTGAYRDNVDAPIREN